MTAVRAGWSGMLVATVLFATACSDTTPPAPTRSVAAVETSVTAPTPELPTVLSTTELSTTAL
ncbi:MAG: hypothetical protein INR72_20685, partial [Williamsia herbipolensis]|nr:hypothetical protein [Williamsia herbipolensis]